MNWNAIGIWAFEHLRVFFAGIGLTGGGVGFIKLMKHWPAPKKRNAKLGAIFDTLQDVISNNERIGQRSDADSTFVTTTGTAGKSESVQAITPDQNAPAAPPQKAEK